MPTSTRYISPNCQSRGVTEPQRDKLDFAKQKTDEVLNQINAKLYNANFIGYTSSVNLRLPPSPQGEGIFGTLYSQLKPRGKPRGVLFFMSFPENPGGRTKVFLCEGIKIIFRTEIEFI